MGIEVIAAYCALVLACAALLSVRISHVRDRRKVQALLDDYSRAQATSRDTENRLRLLLSHVPAVFWTVDRKLHVTSMTGGGTQDQRLSEARAVGKPIVAVIDGEDHKRISLDALERAIAGEAVRYESRSNGRWFQSDVEPLRDDMNEIVGAIAMMLDVTEIRENAERFARLARQDPLT